MTTTVFLVRHAAHDRLGRVLCGRMAGVTLGDEGLAEAERVAGRLAGEGLAAVYASPLERAVATAQPIARAAGVQLRIDEGLNEIDFGDWNGAAFADLEGDERWAAWNRERRTARPPNGESMGEAKARVVGWA
ncbi:MAG TPA: histidine phosphatase family protein, partial [Caulobacteraceae bacterium]|nr:histidine phosphatase family protein [Caulobacteraceae bacterium]